MLVTSQPWKSELQKPEKKRVSHSQSATQGSQVQYSAVKRNRLSKIFQTFVFQNILEHKTPRDVQTILQYQEDERTHIHAIEE